MISFSGVWTWLNDPLNWQPNNRGPGILAQIGSHLQYSLIALVVSAVIAVPLGLFIGHTAKGRWLVSGANSLRSLPTTGLLILFYIAFLGVVTGTAATLVPTEIVLVLLAVPPILANTYAGVEGVDPGTRDAAYGMGMTGGQVLTRVEVPIAAPLMFSGLRSATLQVIATATVASYVGLGGLGRFVFDGLSQRDYAQMIGGAILVAVLALIADLLLAALQRYAVSRGVSGRFRRARRHRLAALSGASGRSGGSGAAPVEDDARTAAVEEVEAART